MSDQGNMPSRVATLEAQVSDLRRELGEVRALLDLKPAVAPSEAVGVAPLQQPSIALSPAVAVPPLPPPPPLPKRPFASAQVVRGSEYWFNKIGIGLLLLGLAFLFTYAVDQGWLTPAVRVGIGVLVGAVLLGLGLRLRPARPAFAEVLMGGGVGALYLSAFAAFQLYQLIPYLPAFGLMCAITALAYGLGLWQNSQILVLIATLGGLATPFLLYNDTGSVAGLVGYSSIVIAGAVAIYLARSWRLLLLVATLGGWALLLSAWAGLPTLPQGTADRWAVQAGIVWAGLLFWPLPLLWWLRQPDSQQASEPPGGQPGPLLGDLAAQIVLTPFLALTLTAAVWELSGATAGWLALGLAALAALVAVALRPRRSAALLAYAHAVASLLLLTTAIALLLDGNALLIALAVEAALAHLVAGKRQDRVIATLAHLLFAGLLVGVLGRLLVGVLGRLFPEPTAALALLNLPALTNLAVLGLAVAASLGCYPRALAPAYWLVAHLLLLGLLARELAALPDGSGYVTIAWGIYGAILLVGGLRFDRAIITLFGIGTLLLVVAKLLLIDLAALAAIWRILLFLGFGAAFLLLSYSFRALWRPGVRSGSEP